MSIFKDTIKIANILEFIGPCFFRKCTKSLKTADFSGLVFIFMAACEIFLPAVAQTDQKRAVHLISGKIFLIICSTILRRGFSVKQLQRKITFVYDMRKMT